jgi:hypothetical protein
MMARREPSRFRQESDITDEDVRWGLSKMAQIVQLDGTPTYLPLLERLLAERDKRERQAELIRRAAEIAAE